MVYDDCKLLHLDSIGSILKNDIMVLFEVATIYNTLEILPIAIQHIQSYDENVSVNLEI